MITSFFVIPPCAPILHCGEDTGTVGVQVYHDACQSSIREWGTRGTTYVKEPIQCPTHVRNESLGGDKTVQLCLISELDLIVLRTIAWPL